MATPEHVTLSVDELVSIADRSATAAATKVARQYRGRPVVLAALAGAIVASAVAIPTTLIVSHDSTARASRQAVATAKANCRNIKSVAAIEGAIYADQGAQTRLFLANSSDRFGLTPEQFTRLEHAREQTETERIGQLQTIARAVCGTSDPGPKAEPPPKKP